MPLRAPAYVHNNRIRAPRLKLASPQGVDKAQPGRLQARAHLAPRGALGFIAFPGLPLSRFSCASSPKPAKPDEMLLRVSRKPGFENVPPKAGLGPLTRPKANAPPGSP